MIANATDEIQAMIQAMIEADEPDALLIYADWLESRDEVDRAAAARWMHESNRRPRLSGPDNTWDWFSEAYFKPEDWDAESLISNDLMRHVSNTYPDSPRGDPYAEHQTRHEAVEVLMAAWIKTQKENRNG